ncbi:hypothetical protein CY34DRAFT_814360 [Suillus luteus UH-Slu-Lm8-n1]|uniref:Uncharacterized protein n=1 Tax=Suillus luteus UH-Slu-Lm8-n1 TaxID=930992 RepID=A0A0C9ZSL2_9AGAM|nr:hypothetical protein CY34DRAFT_814360 [Suillus luteus UH-Slu-Lm8-n1]
MGVWLEAEDIWHWFVHAVSKAVSYQHICCVEKALRSADRAMSVFLYLGTMLMTMITNRQHLALPLHSARFFQIMLGFHHTSNISTSKMSF